jgi:hypothetical protein
MASSDPVPDPNFYTWPFQLTKTMHRNPNPAVLPSNPSNSQKGKIVIITGAYGGIGAVLTPFVPSLSLLSLLPST